MYLIFFLLIILLFIAIFITTNISKKKKEYFEDIQQLKNSINTKSLVKSSILFWLDCNKIWADEKLVEISKNEILNNLKDKKFREKIRETFWISLYNIILWLLVKNNLENNDILSSLSQEENDFLNEISEEEKKFFEDDQMKSYLFLNEKNQL